MSTGNAQTYSYQKRQMKNLIILLLCSIVVAACSVLSPGPTPTLAPTLTNTRTPAPSATATVPTQTFTNTPTLIVAPRTNTPTADTSITQTVATPLVLITPDTVTPSPKMTGFISVLVSEKEFYKGKKCEPSSVNFTAQVSEPGRSAYVVLFLRFKGKRSGVTSVWTSLKMNSKGAGTFSYDLTSDEMIGVASFSSNPWVEYQLVTTESNTHEIGRTDIFSERLSLLDCRPELTPQISATPATSTP
jgi:hypothetical protein